MVKPTTKDYFEFVFVLFIAFLVIIYSFSIIDGTMEKTLIFITLFIFVTYPVLMIFTGLTTLTFTKEGVLVKRWYNEKFHEWNNLKVIRHERYRPSTSIIGASALSLEGIYFSVHKKTKKEGKYPEYYLIFRNKLDNFFLPLATEKFMKKDKFNYQGLIYSKKEIFRLFREWGVNIDLKYENTSS